MTTAGVPVGGKAFNTVDRISALERFALGGPGLLTNPPVVLTGSGAPVDSAFAPLVPPIGSLYLRNDGAAGTTLYAKTAVGTWTPLAPAAAPPTPPVVLMATVKLTAAQLKALPGAPIQLLPAPGANKFYLPFSASATYKFVTTPYTIANGDNFIAIAQGGEDFNGFIATGFVDQAASGILLSENTSNPAAEAGLLNQPLVITLLGTTPALTLGDGTLQVDLLYAVVTVQ